MRDVAQVGDVIAERYVLRERIGAGGMGVVWQAQDRRLDRTVALKCAKVDDERAVVRLRREAANAAALDHPNIVSVYDYFHDGLGWWIAMEYVPSRSLAGVMAEEGLLPPVRVAAIGRQIADALAAAHAKGIVHRDVTPENILVTGERGEMAATGETREEVAKLADFGISHALWGETLDGSTTGGVRGKPRYMAPEVAKGHTASVESDLFSLGASLFAAVEGGSPYGEATSPMAYIARALAGQTRTPRRAGPLTRPLTALLRKNPRDRPTAARTRQLLEEIAPLSQAVRSPPGSEPAGDPVGTSTLPLWRWYVTRRQRWSAAGVVAVFVLGTLAWLLWGPGPAINPGPDREAGSAAPKGAAARSGIGDDRRADPCALLDAASLRRFGPVRLVTDYGNFDRCDLLVDDGGADSADVAVTLLDARVEIGSQVRTRKTGDMTVAAEPLGDGECDRTVRLADGKHVQIMARQTGSALPDLCAMADTATAHAVTVLRRGPVPPRASAPVAGSLATADACELLPATALRRTPGLGAARPEADFGHFGCEWNSPSGDRAVGLVFDRNDPPLEAEGGRPVQLSGKQALVAAEPDEPGTCDALIVQRTFTDLQGESVQERVKLTVSGAGPVAELCGTARDLGAVAAGRLPKA
ncbi:protein kinase [Streptomyces polygonati]|uniref:Protein kinase n=1 Tax=Streptomyces polygonati TaxID=1617087 RepID=A0ABV8HMZ9_9ACTN